MYRSWRVISTPTPWLGISILVLMTGAKFLRINLNELHEVVTYLKRKKKCFTFDFLKKNKNKINLHFKFTLQ